MGRALPDVRDGMKPVHRRILHSMRLLRLNPETGFAKCARIVGEVMGKFHPHGDQSIYDALVRLSQSFSQRYPLVDGQGNFGNIDGDNAAAMRYTEARMTHVATELMDGITQNAVDFRATYNEEDEEVDMELTGAWRLRKRCWMDAQPTPDDSPICRRNHTLEQDTIRLCAIHFQHNTTQCADK